MNAEMIRKWNEKIEKNDRVYHLGDISLASPEDTKDILNQLNGKIYLILGNHDKSTITYPKRFEWIKEFYELNVADEDAPNGKQKIVLLHYAMRVWRSSFRGTWHLYGHSHGHLKDDETMQSFDVGVDCHDFYPLSYEEVKAIMAKKKWFNPFKDERRTP